MSDLDDLDRAKWAEEEHQDEIDRLRERVAELERKNEAILTRHEDEADDWIDENETLHVENAKLRAALEAIDNALVDAMQADCENGVAWLNDKAAAAYLKDFPATKQAIDFCITTTRAEALK